MLNPLIYTVSNKEAKRALKKVLGDNNEQDMKARQNNFSKCCYFFCAYNKFTQCVKYSWIFKIWKCIQVNMNQP